MMNNRIENATEMCVDKDARQKGLRAVVLMGSEDARCKMELGRDKRRWLVKK
jgi:hypothetical protein